MFRQRLGADTVISEEEWKMLLDEDEAFDYANCGVGREELTTETCHERIEIETISSQPGDRPTFYEDYDGHDD